MASHVVSKKRVADHGEVYTREKEVKAMLDLVHQETLRIESRFLEPACGTKSNKNDENDAEGVCEAVTRPNMRFVSAKTVGQQDLQALHRVRSRVLKERTALANQARGLLAEYGVAVAQGIRRLRHALPRILEDAENGLSSDARELFAELYEQLLVCDERVDHYDARIKQLFNLDSAVERPVWSS
jgi:transposase